MRIIFRNFIKLLSEGAFNTKAPIENMSEFKWRQLLRIAETSDVSDIISTGIVMADKHDGTAIPYNIIEAAKEYAAKKRDNQQEKEEQDKFTQLPIKKFANFHLNRKLNKIIFNEIHSIDTSVDTLTFLNKLVDNANILLNTGINLGEIANLGLYLRTNGNTIDFVKTERWLKQLKMGHVTNLIGSFLIVLFGFEPQEIPFLKKPDKKSEQYIISYLDGILNGAGNARNVKRSGNLTTLNPIPQPTKTSFKFFAYFPLEVASLFVSHTIKSLSNIEE